MQAVDVAIPSQEARSAVGASQLSVAWHRFRRRKLGVAGLVILILLAMLVVIVPVISPFGYNEKNSLLTVAPVHTFDLAKGHMHWLGTDPAGRDILTRIFYAGRASLALALGSMLAVVAVGSVIGAIAGLYGGWVDALLMRAADFLLALPALPMFLFTARWIRASLGQVSYDRIDAFGSIAIIGLVFVAFSWMGISRLVRASILSLRSREFVEAARALGASRARIIFKHLLPNSIGPVLVAATFAVGDFIILEAGLAYFAQGIVDPPTPSWGNMLADYQALAPFLTNLNPFEDIRGYLVLFPSFMVLLTVLCVNYIGDALRDALDPRRAL